MLATTPPENNLKLCDTFEIFEINKNLKNMRKWEKLLTLKIVWILFFKQIRKNPSRIKGDKATKNRTNSTWGNKLKELILIFRSRWLQSWRSDRPQCQVEIFYRRKWWKIRSGEKCVILALLISIFVKSEFQINLKLCSSGNYISLRCIFLLNC